MDQERLLAVLRAFERHGVEYVIFGAVALNVHGLARATVDMEGPVRRHILDRHILTRLGEMYSYDRLPRERLPFAGFSVPVVTARALYHHQAERQG